MENRPGHARFIGKDGYPHEREFAGKHLVVGNTYPVIGGQEGSTSTHIVLGGVGDDLAGRQWNSVMFDMDIDTCNKVVRYREMYEDPRCSGNESSPGNISITEYEKLALVTAVYPSIGDLAVAGCARAALPGTDADVAWLLSANPGNLEYPVIGLAGEVSEVLLKLMTTNEAHGVTDELITELIPELGDVLWYVNATANELGVTLNDVLAGGCKDVHGVDIGWCLLQHLEDTPLDLGLITKLAVWMSIRAGEIANSAKKVTRDMAGEGTSVFKEDALCQLMQLFNHMALLCSILGVSWDTVSRYNLEKLASRKSRGMLQGSGDHR